jgi:hypothetical protein
MKLEVPFGLSLPFDSAQDDRQYNPFGLSLSKPISRTAVTLRHGAFDKLSPLLRANGCCVRRERGFSAEDPQ